MNLKTLLVAIGLTFGASLANAGLVITPTFDSTISGDMTNGSAIESVINNAITAFEDTFTNPITVDIYFQAGGGLGQSNTVSYNNTYSDFYSGLVSTDANQAAIAGLNANGGNANTNGGVSPVSGTSGNADLAVKSANGRAVGITGDVPACTVTAVTPSAMNGNIPNDCGNGTGPTVDAIVSLNTAITNPGGGSFPLLATTEHEIDEVLGLGSTLLNCDDTKAGSGCTAASAYNTTGQYAAPEDLFRYDGAGVRTLSTVCSATPESTNLATQPSAYFAYGSGTGNIAQFNNDCNGGDFGYWQSSPLPNGVSAEVQDAFTGPGAGPTLGTAEIDALSAIGYTTTVAPEPGTIALFGFGCAGLLAYRLPHRRRAHN